MWRRVLLLTWIVLGISTEHVGAVATAQAPWFGSWELNVSKSSPRRDRPYKRTTLKIEPWADGLKVTYDLVGTRGGVTHMEWVGRFDGKDYSVQGLDYVMTNAYTLLNERSYRIAVKVDGSVAATATVVVSDDGQTLTTTTTENNSRGQEIQTTAVYERQR
jgi:hypothetical protein